MRFLIVDDSAVDRHFLASLLEEMGHQVEMCESTIGVLEKLTIGKYTALFLDIVMPDKDGYKFLRELRLNEPTVNQHVILYSIKSTAIEINYGLKRAGASDYLTKPTTREQLEQLIGRILINGHAHQYGNLN
ncbi:MAG: response regulator [Leptolyngbyaceae cyanobacterium RU_5_1]|nr:response regulator [Leptolyngbyaceae cyanobacterium RU_5_1]